MNIQYKIVCTECSHSTEPLDKFDVTPRIQNHRTKALCEALPDHYLIFKGTLSEDGLISFSPHRTGKEWLAKHPDNEGSWLSHGEVLV